MPGKSACTGWEAFARECFQEVFIMLVIPSYNKIILPDAEVYFQADQFRGVAGRSFAVGEKVVLLILKEDQTKEQWTEDSFYPIGVAGVIGEVSEQGYVSVITQNRVDITHVSINPDRSIDLTISRRDDIQDLDEAASYQKLQALKKEVIDLTANTQFAEFIRQFVEPMNSIATLACGLSPWLTASSEERYAVLAEDSANARSEKLAQMLYEYFEVTRVSGEANASQQKEYQDQYREAAIRKQMQYLHERDGAEGGREGSEPAQTGGTGVAGVRHALRLSGFCHVSVLEGGAAKIRESR